MNMRKALLISVALLLCLSMLACDTHPVPPETSGKGETGSNTEPTANGSHSSTTAKPVVMDVDLTAPWAVADIEGANCAAFSDEGYYYYDGHSLHFMDTQNGISVILCHKAGCKHDDYDCDAFIENPRLTFYSDGYIYYNKLVREDPYSIHLFRRKADGTAEEKVAVLGQEYISPNVSLGFGTYIVADGVLYFVICTNEAVPQDDGSLMLMERDGILLRLDLKTGKHKEITRKRDTLIRLLGARRDALLFYTQDKLPAEENQDPDYFERMLNKPARLQVWSASADECFVLFEKTYKEFTRVFGLQNNKLHYRDKEKMYTYDLATGIHSASGIPSNAIIVSENYIRDNEYDPLKKINPRFMDLRTGQYITSDYDDTFIAVKNKTERGFIMQITYDGDPIPNGGGSYSIPRLRQILAYVALDSLEDGLQESDLLVIRDETFEE